MFGCVGRVLAVAVVLASVVPVLGQAQCPDGSPAPCRSAAVAAPAPTSVAVLYFDNASPDSTDDYLAEGLTEAIIAQLGQVGRISVKSRSARSEEHTSELQSRLHLVCRLLLEKKNLHFLKSRILSGYST